jgi:hypothetical protein
VIEAVLLGNLTPEPVNRSRLARYLELPSLAELDEVTAAEIDRLDARRDLLLSLWRRAVAVPIKRIDGPWVELDVDPFQIEATAAYGHQLRASGADQLIVAALTLGQHVDSIIKNHLDRDEIYEAFVLKQWAATMTEQARIALTRALRGWTDNHGRSLLPYDGPGYNGWPLASLSPLLEMLYATQPPHAQRPVRATDSGVLLPTNSMLIVYGVASQQPARGAPADEPLAQCYRCAMRNCRYRTAATADVACSG